MKYLLILFVSFSALAASNRQSKPIVITPEPLAPYEEKCLNTYEGHEEANDFAKLEASGKALTHFFEKEFDHLSPIEKYRALHAIVNKGAVPNAEFDIPGTKVHVYVPAFVPEKAGLGGRYRESLVAPRWVLRSKIDAFSDSVHCLFKSIGQTPSTEALEAKTIGLLKQNRLLLRALSWSRTERLLNEIQQSCLNLASCKSTSLLVYSKPTGRDNDSLQTVHVEPYNCQRGYGSFGFLIDGTKARIRGSFVGDACIANSPLYPLCGPGNDMDTCSYYHPGCRTIDYMATQHRHLMESEDKHIGQRPYNEVAADIVADSIIGLVVFHPDLAQHLLKLHKSVETRFSRRLPVWILMAGQPERGSPSRLISVRQWCGEYQGNKPKFCSSKRL